MNGADSMSPTVPPSWVPRSQKSSHTSQDNHHALQRCRHRAGGPKSRPGSSRPSQPSLGSRWSNAARPEQSFRGSLPSAVEQKAISFVICPNPIKPVLLSYLALDHAAVHLAGRNVVVPRELHVQKTFVIAEIQINFSAVFENKDLACSIMPKREPEAAIDSRPRSPWSSGLRVPASMFKYGSILIDVTRRPCVLSSRPVEEAMTPFPMPEMTPPVTRMYFVGILPELLASGGFPAASFPSIDFLPRVLRQARHRGEEETRAIFRDRRPKPVPASLTGNPRTFLECPKIKQIPSMRVSLNRLQRVNVSLWTMARRNPRTTGMTTREARSRRTIK